MLIETPETIVAKKTLNQKLSKIEQMINYVRYHESQAKLLDEGDFTIYERQEGNKKTPEELERILLQINPNFRFEVVPNNILAKRLIYDFPDNPNHVVCIYHNFPMPEHSWFTWTWEEVFDPSCLKRSPDPASMGHIDRKDLPKGELIVNEQGELDYQIEPGALRPGYKRIKRPYHEKIRGWRTVLIQVMKSGLATPAQIERLVDPSNRNSWAYHMGKTQDTLNVVC